MIDNSNLNTYIKSFAYIRKVCIKYDMSHEQLMLLCLLYKYDKIVLNDVCLLFGSYVCNWHKVKNILIKKGYIIKSYHFCISDAGKSIVKEFINDKSMNTILKTYKIV